MNTYTLTQMQLFQVLDVAHDKCNEDGDFNIEVEFKNSGIIVWIAGNLHIIYGSYHASDWHNEGYNDYDWESERYATITDAKVYMEEDEYELDDNDLEIIDQYINCSDNFN